MFATTVIDETKALTHKQSKIVSCVEFVADHTIQGIFYVMSDWADRDFLNQPTVSFKPELARILYFSKQELASNKGVCDPKKVKVHAPDCEVVVSFDRLTRRGVLEQQGLNATTAVLVLAAAGIEVALPNIILDRRAEGEIALIRNKLSEERSAYLIAVSKLADEGLSRLKSGDFIDIYEWAKNEATLKIQPKARLLQNNLTKLNRSLLQRAGATFWSEGIPAIGQALTNEGSKGVVKVAAEQMIKILSTNLAMRIEERRIPEANYAFKLSKELLP